MLICELISKFLSSRFLLWRVSVLLMLAFALEAHSQLPDLKIEGRWYPGSMLRGQVMPGSRVDIAGTKVFVDANGQFVFGLGRDEKGPFTIKVSADAQKVKTYTFDIESRQYDLQRITGVEQKYVSPPEEVLKRIQEDNAKVSRARTLIRESAEFRNGFIRPATGPITGVYGSQRIFNGEPKRPHFGLDIAGPVGQSVVAPAAGLVTLVHPDMYYSGGTLIVDHGQGISSTFIHLSKILVKEGLLVEQGQKIAEIGSTGRATGPHLDWRVNWFDVRLDPALLLPPVDDSTP